MSTACLLLGSNKGDKANNLQFARDELGRIAGNIINISGIYETEPWGYISENSFYNQAVLLETSLSHYGLLDKLKDIEGKAGRALNENEYADRSLDIDILFFDELVIQNQELTIPHPRLHLRKFTLIPLVEIAPGFVHPVLSKTVQELLDECADTARVDLL